MLVLIKGLFPLGCSYGHGYTHCAASDRSKLMETWNWATNFFLHWQWLSIGELQDSWK
jgi:hypothetical protein